MLISHDEKIRGVNAELTAIAMAAVIVGVIRILWIEFHNVSLMHASKEGILDSKAQAVMQTLIAYCVVLPLSIICMIGACYISKYREFRRDAFAITTAAQVSEVVGETI
jgi:hypothetical protein